MKTKKKIHHNSKVAQSRGDSWRKNLIRGKLESAQKPSKLRLMRLTRGVSQEKFASDVGTSTNTFGAIERGIRPVTKSRAEKIAKELGKKLNHLFEKTVSNPLKYVAKKEVQTL